MAEQDDHLRASGVLGSVELRAERLRLRAVDRDLAGPAALERAGPDLAEHRLAGPPAQVVEHLLLDEPVHPLGDLAPDAAERVVRPVAGEPDDRADRGAPAVRPVRSGDGLDDVEEHGDARLVVGEVDDDHAPVVAEDVQPAARVLRARHEGLERPPDDRERDAERTRRADCRERIRDVVAGDAAERDRDVGERRDRAPAVAVGLAEPAVADEVRPAAAREVPADTRGSVAGDGEERDLAAHRAGDPGDVSVVGVEDDPTGSVS